MPAGHLVLISTASAFLQAPVAPAVCDADVASLDTVAGDGELDDNSNDDG